jgi:hypothetical protein
MITMITRIPLLQSHRKPRRTELTLVVIAALASAACSGQPSDDRAAAAPAMAVPARAWPAGAPVIGEPIQAGAPVTLAAVKADPAAFFEKTVLVQATAAAICQTKGCWMTITDAAGAGEPIWVRWSSGCGGQYAFPKDAAGRTIIVQGSFYEKEIDEAAAEHLAAENETIDAEKITGTTFEMNATGCVVLPAAAKGA